MLSLGYVRELKCSLNAVLRGLTSHSRAHLDFLLHAGIAKCRYQLVRLYIALTSDQQSICGDQGL
jgi:hypothetical protein